jgi:glycosyltransferase involved in cell wall biosynthesis
MQLSIFLSLIALQQYFVTYDWVEILLYMVLVAGIINLCFYIFYWLISWKKVSNSIESHENNSSGVSLIISSHNSLSHLKLNLLHWLSQDEVDMEVIIVNDRSTDGTKEWLDGQSKQYKQLKVITISPSENPKGGKKIPITRGLAIASHDKILLTDADCTPKSPLWASLMTAPLRRYRKAIIIGAAPLQPANTLISKFGSIESLLIMMQYLSWAIINRPYMGVGRNISFSKITFEHLDGYQKYSHLISGDDDLFVLHARKHGIPIIPVLDFAAWTLSPAKDQISGYLRQKQRHHAVSIHYPWFVQIHLVLFGGTQIFWGVGLMVGIIMGWWISLGIIALLRWGIQFNLYYRWSKELSFKFPGLYYVCFDILYSWMLLLHGLIWRKPVNKW